MYVCMYACMAGQSLEEELDHVIYSLVHVFVPFQRNGQQYKVICMCVWMYVCTCECMYVCVNIFMNVWVMFVYGLSLHE